MLLLRLQDDQFILPNRKRPLTHRAVHDSVMEQLCIAVNVDEVATVEQVIAVYGLFYLPQTDDAFPTRLDALMPIEEF